MLLAIDQGTTGTTTVLYDRRGRIAARTYRELAALRDLEREVRPAMAPERRQHLLAGWHRAIRQMRAR